MKREKLPRESVQSAIDRFWAQTTPARSEIDASAGRVLRHLESQYETLPLQIAQSWDTARRSPRWRWGVAAAGALLVTLFSTGLMLLRVDKGSVATLEAGTILAVEPGEALSEGRSLHVGDGSATVSLSDGSRVELSPMSVFSIVRVSDGLELRLGNGNVLVTAAKQEAGHFYVQAPDCTVSVIGTVFSVRAEEAGTRVSVFEGQVRVTQGTRAYTLSRGEQLATSPVLGLQSLESEIQWSAQASSVAALLKAPAVATPASPNPVVESSTQSGTGATVSRVEGRVINPVTKEPVERVELQFFSDRGVSRTVSSDAEGKYAIDDLPAGRYAIQLKRSGFAAPELHPGTFLSLLPNAQLKGIDMEMVATSAISGKVLDQDRRPLGSAMVHALKVKYVNGRRLLSPGGLISLVSYLPVGGPNPFDAAVRATTNAMGEYRLFGLSPGEYYIAIWSKGESPQVDEPPIYYPGVTDPAVAVPLVVRGGGQEMVGIDLQMPAMKTYTAQFRVVPPSVVGYDCSIVHPDFQVKAFTLVQHTTNLDVAHFSGFERTVGNETVAHVRIRKTADSVWTTSKLAPGSYEIFHSSCAATQFGLSGRLSFTIADRDVDAGVLVVPPTVRISGRVLNPSGATVELRRLMIRLRPLDWRGFFPPSAPNPTPIGYTVVRAEGTFAFEFEYTAAMPMFGRVAPGHFMVDVGGLPPDVYVSSIKYGAKEVRDAGMVVDSGPPGEIEITLNAPGATVVGTVRNARDERVPNRAVVVIPEASLDAPVSLSRTGVTDQEGAFAISGVAPGAYWVVAVPDGVEKAAFDNPEFFRPYRSRSTRVVLQNASSAQVNLRLIPAAR